ncbi:MAG: ribbon-helix-helix protein, CopG family [Jiangellaceae bacterium]
MAKDKMTVTIDPGVYADVDADARAAGLNRSEYVERVLRNEHYRRLLARVEPPKPMSTGEERRLRDLLAWQQTPDSERPASS